MFDEVVSSVISMGGDGVAIPAPQLCISCRRRSGTERDTPLRSVVCGGCWFASGGEASPAEINGSGSSGDLQESGSLDLAESLIPRTALDWYRGLLSSSWYQQIRRDAASRLRGLLAELARRADWDTHTSWPTWDRLQRSSGWRRSSTAAWLAELQRQGWLLRVEGGTTPQYRPMALQHLSGNRAAVYQLRVPAVEATDRAIPTLPPAVAPGPSVAAAGSRQDTTWTPTHSPNNLSKTESVVPTRASTRIHNPQVKPPSPGSYGPAGPGQDEQQGGYFGNRVPVTRAEMLAAAAELRSDPALRRLTPRWIRAIVRSWWEAGWTNNDLRYALEYRPRQDGPAIPVHRCPARQLRKPDGWLRHRLSWWRDAHGPLVSPTVDSRQRRSAALVRGHAAAQRLPYGATDLTPTDLQISSDDHRAARSAIVRQWAAEFTARRNAVRPAAEVATVESSKRYYRRISRALDEGRSRRTATPPLPDPADGHGGGAASSASPDTSSPRNHESNALDEGRTAHERALARARAERTSRPLPRAHRRLR